MHSHTYKIILTEKNNGVVFKGTFKSRNNCDNIIINAESDIEIVKYLNKYDSFVIYMKRIGYEPILLNTIQDFKKFAKFTEKNYNINGFFFNGEIYHQIYGITMNDINITNTKKLKKSWWEKFSVYKI